MFSSFELHGYNVRNGSHDTEPSLFSSCYLFHFLDRLVVRFVIFFKMVTIDRRVVLPEWCTAKICAFADTVRLESRMLDVLNREQVRDRC